MNSTRFFRLYVFAATATWVIVIIGLLLINLRQVHEAQYARATSDAREHVNEDNAFRFWVASVGGVYVPVTDRIQPNANLSHIPERDIETATGKSLTLINSAYLLRLIMKDYDALYGIKGHLAGITPSWKETIPDEWEKAAILKFQEGIPEISEVVTIDGVPYLRLMKPMYVREQCLECHAHQNFTVGNVAGGVSVAVPLGPYLARMQKEMIFCAACYGIVLVVGLTGIRLGRNRLIHHIKGRDKTENALCERTAELVRVNVDLNREVEEHRQAEVALREGEARLRQIIDLVPHMIFVKGWDGKYLLVNEAVAEAYNTSVSAIIGKYHADLHPDESELQEMSQDDREVITKGEAKFIPELPFTDAQGNLRFLQVAKVPFHLLGCNTPAVLGVATDITNIKRAEEVLRESEAQYRLISENTGDVIWQFNLDTDQFVYVSPSVHRLTGFTPEEVVGQNMETVLMPESVRYVSKRLPEVITALDAGDESVRVTTHELDQVRKDGSVVPIEVVTTLLQDATGRADRIIGVSRDITERRHAAEVLRESEAKFRTLFEAMTEGVALHEIVFDDQGMAVDYRIIATNPAFEKHTGLKSEQVLGQLASKIYGLDKAPYLERYALVASSGEPDSFETYFPPMNRFFHISVTSPKRGHFVTVFENITDRKLAETALAESEQRFRSLFENAPVAYQCLDIEGRFIDVNQELCNLLGYRPEELLGRSFGEFWPENIREKFPGLFETFKRNRHISSELPLIAKDGQEISAIVEGLIQQDNEGNFLRTHCILTDITTRKKAEEALKESQQQLTNIIDFLPDATFVINNEGEVIAWNKAIEEMTGVKASDILGKGNFEYALPFYGERRPVLIDLALEPHEEILSKYTSLAKRATGIAGEAYMPALRAGETYLYVTASVLRDSTGNIVGAIESIRDITERKKAEDALRESEGRLKIAMDLAKLVQWEYDVKTGMFSFDDQFYALYGTTSGHEGGPLMTAEAYAGKFIPSEESHIVAEGIAKTLATNDPNFTHQLEHRIIRVDGEERHIIVHWEVVCDQTGKVVKTRGASQDVTERKRAEDALKESQQQLADIIDFLPDATFVIDREGKVIAWNRAMEEMLGISEAAMLGKGGYEYALPFYGERRPLLIDAVLDPSAAVEAKYLTLQRNGVVLAAETYIKDLRGLEAYLFCTASALYDSRGNIIGAIESIRNITERKLMEKAVAEAEARYRDIFENSVTGIYQITVEGRFLSLNMSIARILGYDSPEDLLSTLGDAWQLYVHPERRSELLRLIEEHGLAREFEVEYFRKNRSVVWVSLNVRAVRNSTGEIAYLEGTASDITDRKLLKARLDQAQKMEAIGTLAGGIAHDFNNILQPIIGYTEMALSELSSSDPMRDDWEQVLNASLRAKELVRQILTVSRFTQDQQRIPTDISSIIKEALKLLRSSLPTSIEMRQKIRKGVALADPTQIHQVLMNLCTNASHAMDGEGTLEVRLSNVDLSESDLANQSIVDLKPGPYLKLSVSDTGSGMDKATLERIFDPYFTTKEVGKGSGLGLAIVHGIIKRHEGTITVRSEPGKGTTFSVYIPRIEAADEVPIETLHEVPIGKESILFLDDEQAIVKMGTAMLERLGYKVTAGTDSLRALEVFSARPDDFDLIITDCTMPNLTGTGFAKAVRRIRPDMPVMLCTGFSEKITLDRVKELGIELLMKPYGLRQISEAVRKILDARKGG